MPHRSTPALLLILLVTFALPGCLSKAERYAQYQSRRAQLEVTTREGQPVVLQLVASDDGPARAGVSYVRTEQWRSALDQLHRATDQKSTDHRAWFALGAVYEKTGQLHQAYDAYRTAYFLRNEPDYEDAWRRTRNKGGGNPGPQ